MISAGAEFGLTDREAPMYGNRDDMEAYLQLVAGLVAHAHAGHPVTAVLVGDPAERLADYVEANAIGLVVMTTHGRGGFSRFWLGSVADRLLRRVNAPILLLRHETRKDDAGFEGVVIALDGSPASERALAPAIALGSLVPSPQYTLVRVVVPPLPSTVTPVGLYPPDAAVQSVQELSAAASEYLEAVADRMRAQGCSVVTRVLLGSGIAEQIVGFAERSRSQLVAMGTRGATGFDRLMLGSVADKVVRAAVQPVLVAPGQSRRRINERPVPATARPSHTDNEVLTP
jgi:nucleotide-binding universal stress UspA family protein